MHVYSQQHIHRVWISDKLPWICNPCLYPTALNGWIWYGWLRPEQNGRHFAEVIFKCPSSMKSLNSHQNLPAICSQCSNWRKVSIGSGNGLAPNRQQAITRNNVGHDNRRHIASLCHNEWTRCHNVYSLWHSDAMWRQLPWPTLFRVMACYKSPRCIWNYMFDGIISSPRYSELIQDNLWRIKPWHRGNIKVNGLVWYLRVPTL